MLKTVDVASVQVRENKQRQGWFTKMLVEVEAWADNTNRHVYVENIINPHLMSFLLKRGYERACDNMEGIGGQCLLRRPQLGTENLARVEEPATGP